MIQWSPERVAGSLQATVPVTSDDPAIIAGILSSWVSLVLTPDIWRDSIIIGAQQLFQV
jgi:hypothetical protein